MTQLVREGRHREAGVSSGLHDNAPECRTSQRPAALRHKNKLFDQSALLGAKTTELCDLLLRERADSGARAFAAPAEPGACLEVKIRPARILQFRGAQAVSICQQDIDGIAH